MNNEEGETWSSYDVIGHLIHGEQKDWVERMNIYNKRPCRQTILRPSTALPSSRKQRENTYPITRWVYRPAKRNIKHLREANLTEEKLNRTGIHPKFGAVTLRQLLATWVAHDLAHINQKYRVSWQSNTKAKSAPGWSIWISWRKDSSLQAMASVFLIVKSKLQKF